MQVLERRRGMLELIVTAGIVGDIEVLDSCLLEGWREHIRTLAVIRRIGGSQAGNRIERSYRAATD